ncbi:hypothetical protein [Occallatibacter savannae]|uniref:hypothetical protein n=1 Tax=Occallatibacter savannae TaxID=1002691 RepID=UPI0013A54FB9|nr:hypothetical protein [Occallatibacter savannae]
MKLAFRVLVLSVVVAGAAAASVSSSVKNTMPSHQAATAGLPVPTCGPGVSCTGK